jgi:hypothetical protein
MIFVTGFFSIITITLNTAVNHKPGWEADRLKPWGTASQRHSAETLVNKPW